MPIETYFAIESIYANSNEFMKNEKDILLLGGFIVYYGLQKKMFASMQRIHLKLISISQKNLFFLSNKCHTGKAAKIPQWKILSVMWPDDDDDEDEDA